MSKCPICKTKTQFNNSTVFPFCSQRCQQIDLLRWSKGQYAIIEPLDPDSIVIEEQDASDENIIN